MNLRGTLLKRKAMLLGLAACISLLSCKDDNGPNCPDPVGEMIAEVNDTTIWDFKYVTFYSQTDATISIGAGFVNAGCELELSLDLDNIELTQEKQILFRPVYGDDYASFLEPQTIFYTWNIDALTERFELNEDEPAWIQLAEITDGRVTGTFQGTYVYRQSAFRFWDLPDTLRFNQVYFEAALFTPPE